MVNAGRDADLQAIAADLALRDERDRNRKEAPLRAAVDAMELDTSNLGRDEAIAAAIRLVERRLR
jgi:cytidylate kinase